MNFDCFVLPSLRCFCADALSAPDALSAAPTVTKRSRAKSREPPVHTRSEDSGSDDEAEQLATMRLRAPWTCSHRLRHSLRFRLFPRSNRSQKVMPEASSCLRWRRWLQGSLRRKARSSLANRCWLRVTDLCRPADFRKAPGPLLVYRPSRMGTHYRSQRAAQSAVQELREVPLPSPL